MEIVAKIPQRFANETIAHLCRGLPRIIYMKFEIENVGKLKKAKFELKPLTIFIGKNNSGKTYATTALWALINYLKNLDVVNFISYNLRDKYNKLFKENFIDLSIEHSFNISVSADELKELHKVINEKLVSDTKKILNDAFRYPNFNNSKLELLNDVFNDISLNLKFNKIKDFDEFVQITIQHQEGYASYESGLITKSTNKDELINSIDLVFWNYIAKLSYSVNEFSEIWNNIYIPAARTGIMLDLNNIISEPFRRFVYKEDSNFEINYSTQQNLNNDFTLPTLNFALRLNNLLSNKDREYTYLESLIAGKIKTNSLINRYEYLPDGVNKAIPLSASSSLVTELAPMAILGSDSGRKGFILFEEPEAHLHLEAQREMAKLLVKMVNSGKKVLITTHSDTFLQQLNNLILLERLKKQGKDISEFDISDDELLSEINVVTYEFKCNDGITNVEKLTCGNYGFIADSLNEVLIALSKETNGIIDLIDEEEKWN